MWDTQTGEEVRRLVGHIVPIHYVGFSSDGKYILTGDRRMALVWRAQLADVIQFTCSQLTSDLTANEQELYHIGNSEPVCPEFGNTMLTAQATWTPYVAEVSQITMSELVTHLEFYNDIGNLQMGFPIQDVYIASDDAEGVVRPLELSEELLSQPLYSSAEPVRQDYEPPFDLGPFPRGKPLGITLKDWVAITGQGTYTIHRSRATLDLKFDHLIPNGVYTLWCIKLGVVPNLTVLEEMPCGAPDGSENTLIAGPDGKGEIVIEIDTFPPSTDEVFYEIALAYHSDGQTYGSSPGEFGFNVHAQALYDFLPPSSP